MKILALYLPQFHEIPENNRWWGKGYTEWVAVKNAKKYYTDHYQPVVPLQNNYYDLSDETGSVWKWQADLARKYKVYGFCIYHYWFSTGNQLLEKPMEVLLAHPEIDIRYCICWANETWKRTWYSNKKEILKLQEYGTEKDWEEHFKYLVRFFKDKRYIKVDNKPMINIYHSSEIKELSAMRKLWDELAIREGFSGVYIVAGNVASNCKRESRENVVDAYYNYEPGNSNCYYRKSTLWESIRTKIIKINNLLPGVPQKISNIVDGRHIYEYVDHLSEFNGKKCYLGTFSAYDDSPRRQSNGYIIKSSPELFKMSLNKIKGRLKELGREDDFVYVMAWNEWGEGAHLEPDEKYRFAYLEAIKDCLEESVSKSKDCE